ncbi:MULTISPECIES: sterol desaturase family protein [unclassified Cupriavidus]|uniref:sterol desaturase family protein n=1 Tax=unclassified Cupriavidus TaxID=2640874 RepID=UPI000686B285|nr:MULTISPECIES: sterol desaturase family protein [unclassified Cupriavidus]MBP0634007.1 sterol desaturase family protein [Cupriavidus sp. AcVe19-6a]
MTEFLSDLAMALAAPWKGVAIAAIACGIVWIFEVWKPAAADPGAHGRLHNLAMYAALLLGMAALGPLYGWVGLQLPNVALIDRLSVQWPTNGFLRAILATFVYAFVWDFFQYWKHRAEHTFRILWIFHRTHHADSAMNASTAVRHSFGGLVLGFVLVHIPTMVICGGGTLAVCRCDRTFQRMGLL